MMRRAVRSPPTPENVAASDWLASYHLRLGPEKVAAFQSGFGDYMSTQNSFFAGKEAMTQVGEWFIQFQKQFAPDLVMNFIPAPPPEGGRENCTIFDGSVFTIPNGVQNPDASWEFIKFLSEPEIMGDFCFAIQNVPPKLAPASEERFVADPRFQMAVDLLNGQNAWPAQDGSQRFPLQPSGRGRERSQAGTDDGARGAGPGERRGSARTGPDAAELRISLGSVTVT